MTATIFVPFLYQKFLVRLGAPRIEPGFSTDVVVGLEAVEQAHRLVLLEARRAALRRWSRRTASCFSAKISGVSPMRGAVKWMSAHARAKSRIARARGAGLQQGEQLLKAEEGVFVENALVVRRIRSVELHEEHGSGDDDEGPAPLQEVFVCPLEGEAASYTYPSSDFKPSTNKQQTTNTY